MPDTQRMLYSLQRFHLLALFTSTASEKSISASYAYAWSENLFPFLNESAEWHRPFAECFDIQEDQLQELHDFLCEKWEANGGISFYDLESHYDISGSAQPGPTWGRFELIAACRYIHLQRHRFDQAFWAMLTENGKCPSEAHVISSDFEPKDVYFE